MFCSYCGTKAVEEAVFCQKCGARIPIEDDNQQPSQLVTSSETVHYQPDTAVPNDEAVADKLDVILIDAGTDKVGIIKKVRELTGLGLKESKELAEKAPVLFKKAVTRSEAKSIKAEFMSGGAAVVFKNHKGDIVDIVIHCKVCGVVLNDGDRTCRTCGNTLAKDGSASFDDFGWKKQVGNFKAKPTTAKVLSLLGILLAVVLGVLVLVIVFRLVFSSVISIIVTAALGYIAYHKWGAIYITRHKYNKSSKELQLPEGMTSKTLLEELSGKFNYPYFKGVRYSENGKCLIEGQYSVYPVEFDENNKASLTCSLNEDDKKLRTIILEAIAIQSYINKFFNPNLPFDAVKDLKVLQSAERQRKAIAIVLSVATALIIVVVALEYALPGSLLRITKPGVEVRDAYLSKYSETVTVEKAFHDFFDNEKWTTYTDAGYSYVAFTGACEFMQERAEVRITFKITGEQFIVDSLDVNGREQGDLILYSLLSKIYEGYEEY